MATNSEIEWTDATWNPVTGCTKVSAGCKNCYAERMAARLKAMGQARYRDGFNLALHEHALAEPLIWRKPRTVFVCSMSDLFHKAVPDEFIAEVFAIMGLASWHRFQVLTKRPERMAALLNSERFAELLEEASSDHSDMADDAAQRFGYCDVLDRRRTDWRAQIHDELPLPNVWLGTSVENQETADERIPELLKVPAAVRFLSCEPMLGAVDLSQSWYRCFAPLAEPPAVPGVPNEVHLGRTNGAAAGVDWVICGGESGPNARPMHPDWARSLRDQCQAAGVPFFFKQWGEWRPVQSFEESVEACSTGRRRWIDQAGEVGWALGCEGRRAIVRVGKGAAGRELDGREWNEMPQGSAECRVQSAE